MNLQSIIDENTLSFRIIDSQLNANEKVILEDLLQKSWDSEELPSDIKITFIRKSFNNYFFTVKFENSKEHFFASINIEAQTQEIENKNNFYNKTLVDYDKNYLSARIEKATEKDFSINNFSEMVDSLLSA